MLSFEHVEFEMLARFAGEDGLGTPEYGEGFRV